MARPTKLDDLTAKRIIDAAAAGVSRRAMCQAAGIDTSTLTRWLQAGRDGEEPYCSFRIRLAAAEEKVERKVVSRLMEAIESGHVPAMVFWLKSQRAYRDNDPPANDAADAANEQAEADDLTVTRAVLAALESRKVG